MADKSKEIGVKFTLFENCTDRMTKIAKAFGQTEQEAKRTAKTFNSTLKQMGKQANELKNKMAGLSKVVTIVCSGITTASIVMTNRAIEAGDRIDKMSQKIGLSRQSFQKWDYILSQSGTDIEKMQVGMKTLSQQMVASTKRGSESEKLFRRLGVSVKTSNGQFKTQEQAFGEVIRAFQKMPDGIEKANLAQKLFGKTGSDLRPLLNGVRGDIDKLEKQYVKLGMGMSDKQINAAVKFKDTMDTLQRAFTGLSNSLGADMLPQLQKVADKIVGNIPQIKASVTPVLNSILSVTVFLTENMNELITVATGLATTFVSFKTITTVVAGFNLLSSAMKAVSVAGGIMNAVMLANPFGAIVTGISVVIGVITALELKFHILGNTIKAVGNVFNSVWNKMHQAQPTSYKLPNQNNVPKYASGTSFANGGLSLVGERGPELVNLPRGSQVLNNSDTQKALNKNITINLNIGGSVISEGELINKISMTLGRQLQTALQC